MTGVETKAATNINHKVTGPAGTRYTQGINDGSTRGWTADTYRKQKALRTSVLRALYKKVAATYSPTWWGSTIGDGELNFSVRNGKRWILTAITATICF